MNFDLERIAAAMGLADPNNKLLRLEFGYACVMRVRHLLEDPEVERCLFELESVLAGKLGHDCLQALVERSARLASHHQGSKSIDGCGHAAVSATYAVAKAIEGKALDAASYAAYAVVYGQGGYGAVADRESFAPEFEWQSKMLHQLATRHGLRESSRRHVAAIPPSAANIHSF